MSWPGTECGCAYEDVEDGSVLRRRYFHDPECERAGKPKFGIRLRGGLVTYINDMPLVTYEQAEQAREKIEQVTGEHGEIEECVYVG